MHSFRRWFGPGLVGVMILVGCVPLARNGGLRDGQIAPPIEGTASNGQLLRLSDHRGKVVLVCFWHGN
jgi:hypothetical protein